MSVADFRAIHVSQCSKGEILSPVSLRLPDDMDERLDDLARKTGRSKTYYMIEAIREHIDDLEDLYLAEERYGVEG